MNTPREKPVPLIPYQEANQTIYKVLRYIEWVSLSTVALRLLLPTLILPTSYKPDVENYIMLCALVAFAGLSNFFPLYRPRWQRRSYILVEFVCLLAVQTFTGWRLDLFLYLILVKSCFLLRRSDIVLTTVLSGVAWQTIQLKKLFYDILISAVSIREGLEYFGAQSQAYKLWLATKVVESISTYGGLSLLIILLSMAILSERKSKQQAIALSQTVEVLAADLERTRIARDIHDSLGHTLTTLDVQLEVAQTLYVQSPEQSLRALTLAKTLSLESLQEVRWAVSTMRHGSLNVSDGTVPPLALRIAYIIDQIKQTNRIRVESQIDLPNLSPQASYQLYLIIKEGLTNVQKHAQASTLKLWAQATPKDITVELSDNGIGFLSQLPSPGFGLAGMQERVHLLGGKIAIISAIGKGTWLQVTIPRH